MYGFWEEVWKFATSLQKQASCEYQAYIGICINKVNSNVTHVITSCMPWDYLSVQPVYIFLSSEILEGKDCQIWKVKTGKKWDRGLFLSADNRLQLTLLSVNIRVRRKDLNTKFRETLPNTVQSSNHSGTFRHQCFVCCLHTGTTLKHLYSSNSKT